MWPSRIAVDSSTPFGLPPATTSHGADRTAGIEVALHPHIVARPPIPRNVERRPPIDADDVAARLSLSPGNVSACSDAEVNGRDVQVRQAVEQPSAMCGSTIVPLGVWSERPYRTSRRPAMPARRPRLVHADAATTMETSASMRAAQATGSPSINAFVRSCVRDADCLRPGSSPR